MNSWWRFVRSGGLQWFICDEDEWTWLRKGDPVLHIDLRNAADLTLVCPASANTIAKAAAGMSDSLALSVIRAWDYSKPLVLCPAMNTVMWTHPLTEEHLSSLRRLGGSVVEPVSKTLACNDTGVGALAAVDDIVADVRGKLNNLAPRHDRVEFPTYPRNGIRLFQHKSKVQGCVEDVVIVIAICCLLGLFILLLF